MYQGTLLEKLVYEPDPLPNILDFLVSELDPLVQIENISNSYDGIEEHLRDFELWLHNIWGIPFYQVLLGKEADWAIPKAFKMAKKKDCNILICDGFSIRELLVLEKAFAGKITYQSGRSPVPTTTGNVSMKVFSSTGLKEAISGSKLYWGKEWTGRIIDDISNPPRIGSQSNLMFLTQHTDATLHQARAHSTTQIQDVSKVITQIINLIEELSKNSQLVITGDHGYIYLGSNPNKYMWVPYRRQERYGGEYGENGIEVDGTKVAVGRYHANVSTGSNTFITHGGISLTESLVPIVTIEAGSNT
jgi:hypothetical protein